MLEILAYTEPTPVNTAENEKPQIKEDDENQQGSFAELLAGILNRHETNLSPEIEITELSGENFDFDISIDESDVKTDMEFLQNLNETAAVIHGDLSDEEILHERWNIAAVNPLVNDRDLLSVQAEAGAFDINAEIDIDAELQQSVRMAENHLPEAEIDADLAKAVKKSSDANILAASAQKEAADGKKENFLKDGNNSISEKTEVRLNENEVKKEKLSDLQEKPEAVTRVDSRSRRSFSVDVRDMRTDAVSLSNQTRSFTATEASAGRTQGDMPVREITLDLRLPDQIMGQNSQAQTSWEVKAGNALENMLARELHQNFNGDIVRHASMALRDGGAGTIRIALHPETLGNVKIQLEMAENKITGRIVVESTEALNAFRKELSSLEQAFRDFGFTSADLNLSLTSEGQSADDWEQETNSFMPRMAALRYGTEQEIRTTVDVLYEQRPGSVNVLA
ncbi:MAG: flagellar hook-length control protein FliK [Treponema sp.]|nr:flagellar hook-length control protein FliK [Treponema sp.]